MRSRLISAPTDFTSRHTNERRDLIMTTGFAADSIDLQDA